MGGMQNERLINEVTDQCLVKAVIYRSLEQVYMDERISCIIRNIIIKK